MAPTRDRLFTAPLFLGTAFLLFVLALIEKLLNVFALSIPFVDIFPRQILDWAVILLMFEIALSIRQGIELWHAREADRERGIARERPDLH
ncbi:MAG TPA: hypothetical protein VFH97_01900 [Gemmatimonadales bacterium]|nr:hypothetical protein [Gemmatimonadales bacterium]